MKNTLQNWVWSTRNFFVRLKEKLHLNPNLPTWAKALIYLSPALILLALFTFYPIINAFRLVIYTGYQHVRSVDGTLVESITGYTLFGNFAKVLSADNFIFPSSHTNSSVLLNTLAIVFISVPISILASLFVAATLNSIKPLKSFFQTIFFLPYITNTLAIGLVFAYMFKSGESGIVNQFFMLFGINPVSWIERGATYWRAMTVLIAFGVWDGMAFKIMVFLSGMQGIDAQYYQAAAIDATPKRRVFTKITVPMISPMIFYIVVTSVIGAFKTYSSVVAIFGDSATPSGANYNLKTIVFHIYDYIYSGEDLSLAAAASIILFAIILALTLVQMYVGKKRVHY
jgi:multiple sugar transport system permease protein